MKCLALAVISFILTIPTLAQETQYITGVGVVKDSRGRLDIGRSMGAARENLYKNILELTGKHVVNHTTFRNTNGRHDYQSTIAVDSGIRICDDDIEYLLYEGFWVARIERSKVLPEKVTWKEEHITINNTHYEPTTYFRGYRRDRTVTRTTRRTDVRGPSGNVVKTTPGRGNTTTTTKNWNGRCGSTWEITRQDKNWQ